MAALRIKRGTRAQIDAAAGAGTLAAGEPYLITDDAVFAIGLSNNTYSPVGPSSTLFRLADGSDTALPNTGVASAVISRASETKSYFMAGW